MLYVFSLILCFMGMLGDDFGGQENEEDIVVCIGLLRCLGPAGLGGLSLDGFHWGLFC